MIDLNTGLNEAEREEAEKRKQIAMEGMRGKIDFAKQVSAAIGLILNNQLQTEKARIRDRLQTDIQAINEVHDLEIKTISDSQKSDEAKELAITLARENRESKINDLRDAAVAAEKKVAHKRKKFQLTRVIIESAFIVLKALPN